MSFEDVAVTDPTRTKEERTLAATAWADGPGCVRAAVEEAVDGLGGSTPSLVILFPDAGIPPADVLTQAAGLPCPVAGMTSEGILGRGEPRSGGCGALAFGPELQAGVGLARGAAADLRAAGWTAAERAMAGLDLVPGRSVVLLLLDPTVGDESAVIDGAYDAVGAHVPIAGGGANGLAPILYADATACADAAVAVSITSPRPIAVGVGHGCVPRGVPSIVTRAEGRAVRELDGRPAELVYLEGLGHASVPLAEEDFEALAALHPLAQPEPAGTLRLRHVRGRAAGGGLATATDIPPNAVVWQTEQTVDTIVQSAGEGALAATEQLGGPARAALVFDCAARRAALGAQLDREVTELLSALAGVPAVTGLYTRGEVGRIRGAKGDLNHAVVTVAFA